VKKEISVIVPVYNGEKYISDFIKRITNQSIFEQIFVILVNDGSIDNTFEKLKECENNYPDNIKVLNKKNGGVSSARNVGLEILETKYFSFVDIDDMINPYLFEKLYEIIQKTNADMVCSGIEKITVEQSKTIKMSSVHKQISDMKIIDSEAAIRMLLQNPEQNAVYGKIYRTDKCGHLHFDERLAISEDKLFVFYCMMNSTKICLSSEKLYFYIQQPVSAMTYSNARKKLGQDIVLDIIDKEIKNKYPDTYPLCVSVRTAIHSGSYIKVYTNDKKYQEKCKFYRQSVRKCPIKMILKELSGTAIIKILCVRYIPFIFLWKRIRNWKKLI